MEPTRAVVLGMEPISSVVGTGAEMMGFWVVDVPMRLPGDFGVGMPEEDNDLRPIATVGASEKDIEGGVAYGAVGVMCGYAAFHPIGDVSCKLK